MEKYRRRERYIAQTRMLSMNPNKIMPYGVFCDAFSAAKSSISEDMAMIEKTLSSLGLGQVETIAGAAGGARFRPIIPWQQAKETIDHVAETLNQSDRALPGGYIYLSDLLSNPSLTKQLGAILAMPCYDLGVDFVLTMETKGIPVALMTAYALNVPLVIARRSSKVYEGSAVNISFPDGKGGIETMSLARRAVSPGQKTLIVDDFARGGGTARGLVALMKEFDIQVKGLGFLLAQHRSQFVTEVPEWPLMTFSGDGIRNPIKVKTASWLEELGESEK